MRTCCVLQCCTYGVDGVRLCVTDRRVHGRQQLRVQRRHAVLCCAVLVVRCYAVLSGAMQCYAALMMHVFMYVHAVV